jgi:hypothetical protein
MRLRSGRKINEKEPIPADNGVCGTFTCMFILFAVLKGTQMLVSSMV